ncbi:MAG: hypothetical protein HY861_02550 [Chlamydiia bacterium]|nr:hypothetical protein [Chlamydiia bacterium]
MPGIDPIEKSKKVEAAVPPLVASPIQPSQIDELSSRVQGVARTGFPNIPLAAVQLGLAKEQMETRKIQELSKAVKQDLAVSNLLLTLSSSLTALPSDKSSHAITDKIRSSVIELEKHGISLPISSDTKTITKEQLTEIKASISEHNSRLRSQIQSTVSTEIQPTLTRLQSMMNTLSEILRATRRESDTFIKNQIPR